MKFLPLVLLSFFAIGCASDQQNEEDVIQREEDIQMQEEELQRTGASEEIYNDPAATSPYPVN